MSSIELLSPPGVSSTITSAAACSLSARLIESLTKLAETGLISLSSVIAITCGRESPAWALDGAIAAATSASATIPQSRGLATPGQYSPAGLPQLDPGLPSGRGR